MKQTFITVKRTLLFKLHWRVGVVSAFMVLWVAITGLMLNHSRSMGLHELHSEWQPLLYAYNMQLPEAYVQSIEQHGNEIIITTKDETLTLTTQENIDAVVAHAYRGDGVNIEKLVLDLHSGHIFGLPGTVLFDLTALAMIFLTATGLYNLWQRKRKH